MIEWIDETPAAAEDIIAAVKKIQGGRIIAIGSPRRPGEPFKGIFDRRENADFIARAIDNPFRFVGTEFGAVERIKVALIVDKYGISVDDVLQRGLEYTPHGLVVARYVRDRQGSKTIRNNHIRVRAQLLTGRHSA